MSKKSPPSRTYKNTLSTQNVINIKEDLRFSIKNGIPNFKNWDEYYGIVKELNGYNQNSLSIFAQKLGYKPYSIMLYDALSTLENVTSFQQLNKVMKEYKDFLSVKMYDGETHYGLLVFPNRYTNIANEKGLYIIGSTAYRIIGEFILYIKKEKISKLLNISYSDIKNSRSFHDIKIIKYSSNVDLSIGRNFTPVINIDSATNTTNYKHFITEKNETSTRRVYLHIEAYWTPYPSTNHVDYYAYIEASAERTYWWSFGGWLPYKTEINIEGLNATNTDFEVLTPWGIKSYDIPHMVSTEDCSTLRLPAPYYGFGPKVWDAYPGPEIYILHAYLKAWTRGTTSSVCAVINYDY